MKGLVGSHAFRMSTHFLVSFEILEFLTKGVDMGVVTGHYPAVFRRNEGWIEEVSSEMLTDPVKTTFL
jgi:hypothetical protein